jgi:hypothetical protein
MIDTPGQVVLDHLADPPGTACGRSQGAPGQPVAVVVEGGPGFEADLATVRFVKERPRHETADPDARRIPARASHD